jgi:hypothetical protein
MFIEKKIISISISDPTMLGQKPTIRKTWVHIFPTIEKDT